MRTRVFAPPLLASLALVASGCGGGDEPPANDEVRACFEKAGYTTTAGARELVPDGPPPIFEVISPDATHRFVVARGADEEVAERGVDELREFAGAADRVRREGVYVVASQTARPPDALMECFAG
ncbi:MAG: hypothetical protein M3389_01630 [Actinomycetota bacterium]|nr:hypothetical protein [Actinomycetota bacterium]